MMELLNALASTEGKGIRALKVFLIHHKLPAFPCSTLPAELHCLKSHSTFLAVS